MISDALRTEIENWASRRGENAMFRMAQEGTLTREMTMEYVANVTYMIHRTAEHLRRARDHARRLGDESLARHYEHKLDEELGHHVWGEADLASFEDSGVRLPNAAPLEATLELASYLTSAIDRDPALYLCYLAMTEYVTALVGPEFLSLVEDCGVPRSSMTVIDNHVELDRDHAEEAWGVIDDLVPDPRRLSPMRDALRQMTALFDALCAELTMVKESHAAERARVSAA